MTRNKVDFNINKINLFFCT